MIILYVFASPRSVDKGSRKKGRALGSVRMGTAPWDEDSPVFWRHPSLRIGHYWLSCGDLCEGDKAEEDSYNPLLLLLPLLLLVHRVGKTLEYCADHLQKTWH